MTPLGMPHFEATGWRIQGGQSTGEVTKGKWPASSRSFKESVQEGTEPSVTKSTGSQGTCAGPTAVKPLDIPPALPPSDFSTGPETEKKRPRDLGLHPSSCPQVPI